MCVTLGGTVLGQSLPTFRLNLDYQCLLTLKTGWLTQKKIVKLKLKLFK